MLVLVAQVLVVQVGVVVCVGLGWAIADGLCAAGRRLRSVRWRHIAAVVWVAVVETLGGVRR